MEPLTLQKRVWRVASKVLLAVVLIFISVGTDRPTRRRNPCSDWEPPVGRASVLGSPPCPSRLGAERRALGLPPDSSQRQRRLADSSRDASVVPGSDWWASCGEDMHSCREAAFCCCDPGFHPEGGTCAADQLQKIPGSHYWASCGRHNSACLDRAFCCCDPYYELQGSTCVLAPVPAPFSSGVQGCEDSSGAEGCSSVSYSGGSGAQGCASVSPSGVTGCVDFGGVTGCVDFGIDGCGNFHIEGCGSGGSGDVYLDPWSFLLAMGILLLLGWYLVLIVAAIGTVCLVGWLLVKLVTCCCASARRQGESTESTSSEEEGWLNEVPSEPSASEFSR